MQSKAAGVPVDRYANESIELLKDIDARWRAARAVRDSVTFAKNEDPQLGEFENAPNADIYPIEVSFQTVKDKAERDYLNELPTSFALPDEGIDRLRAAAVKIIHDSPELQNILNQGSGRIVDLQHPAGYSSSDYLR